MDLVVDIGNTKTKGAFVKNGILVKEISPLTISKIRSEKIETTLVSAVGSTKSELVDFLKLNAQNYLELSAETPTPLTIKYKSKETLGLDRLCAVVGAFNSRSKKPYLVIDIGTCITYDIVNEYAEYLGGSISPGIKIRNKAMHDYTNKLPLIKVNENPPFIGQTTEDCLNSGIIYGIIDEINGQIERYNDLFPDLLVFLTGGSSIYFKSRIKNQIFAVPNLVLDGLVKILKHNVP